MFDADARDWLNRDVSEFIHPNSDEAINSMCDEIEALKQKNEKMRVALQGVLNSALHPEKALRAVMVNLAPVREALQD